jgi:hypothetical protein
VPTVFTKNRDRLLNADIDEHFSLDKLVEAWASMKSFQPKATATGVEPPADDAGSDQDGESTVEVEACASAVPAEPAPAVTDPSDTGRNAEVDFHGQTRSNQTHASVTDPAGSPFPQGKGQRGQALLYGPYVDGEPQGPRAMPSEWPRLP